MKYFYLVGIKVDDKLVSVSTEKTSLSDSIVEYISDIDSSLGEEECYAELIQFLKEEFGKRFNYSMKTDDNLYLDMIRE